MGHSLKIKRTYWSKASRQFLSQKTLGVTGTQWGQLGVCISEKKFLPEAPAPERECDSQLGCQHSQDLSLAKVLKAFQTLPSIPVERMDNGMSDGCMNK